MGRITLFSKEACPFCDAVGEVLRAAILEALRVVSSAPGDTDFCFFGLELAVVDVTHDLARATQCKRLSGASTVPQVFLNGVHIGDCGATEGLFRSGRLVPRLVELASTPPAALSPPDAEVLKITRELACSAQLADGQLAALRSSGVRAMVSLIHPSEPGYRADEAARAAAAGLTFVALPPHGAPVIGTGVVARRMPASWSPHHHAPPHHGHGHHHHQPHRWHVGGHAGAVQQLHNQRWQHHLETLPELAETGQDVLPTSPLRDAPPPPPRLPSPSPSPSVPSSPLSSPLSAAAADLSADYAAVDDLCRARRSSSDAEDAAGGGCGGGGGGGSGGGGPADDLDTTPQSSHLAMIRSLGEHGEQGQVGGRSRW